MADKYRSVFLFCPECNNLLQPNEDKHIRKLVYRCRNCTYSRPAVDTIVEEQCVHRRDITFIAKEDIVVPEGVVHDPSLARKYLMHSSISISFRLPRKYFFLRICGS